MNPSVELNSETARIRAALVNSGSYSFQAADQKLASLRLSVSVGKDAALTPAGQAAFLTAVLTGARCFGEVSVEGALELPLLFPLPIPAKTLTEAANYFGAQKRGTAISSRTIFIGPGDNSSAEWAVMALWNGWLASVAPANSKALLGRGDCAVAGIAAGALAVGQAFLAEQGDLRAGRTVQRLSLWSPEAAEHSVQLPGPPLKELYLPASLWLVGLGNLGQAYLWSLSLLPFLEPQKLLLFLQDDQRVERENWGTSVLVKRGCYGQLKTRIAEDWATGRGFQVRRIDRRLDTQLTRSGTEPSLALAGLDSMPARRLLGGRGFEYVIDAGLGATVADYRKFRLNVFDRNGDPAAHFRGVEDQTKKIVEGLLQMPAYQQLSVARGDGGCGAAMLAETSVAVPFVSAFVGALAITQAVRLASGQAHHLVVTGEVGDLRNVRAALGMAAERPSLTTMPTAQRSAS